MHAITIVYKCILLSCCLLVCVYVSIIPIFQVEEYINLIIYI